MNRDVRRLLKRAQAARVFLMLSVLLGLMSGGLLMLQAYGVATVVNAASLSHARWSEAARWMWVLLGVMITRGLLTWVSQVLASRVALRVKTALRLELAEKLLRLGPAWVAREQRGELVNTAVDGIEQLQTYLSKYLPQMAYATMLPLAILSFILSRDWLAGLILLITAPVTILFMILVGKMAKATSQQQWSKLSLLAAQVLDVLEGLTTLKVFGRSGAQVRWLEKASEDYRLVTMGTLRVAFLSALLMELFSTLSTAVVAVSLGLRLVSGHLSFHTAFLVLLLTPEFYQPIRALGSEFHAGINGVTAATRIFQILDAHHIELTLTGGETSPARAVPSAPFTIEFRDVSFSYDAASAPALNRISFTLQPGKTLALVGPSGSGKSTLLDLLQGFLRPTCGVILINGVPLQELSLVDWRRQVSLLRQRSHVFAGTIAQNLRLAAPDASQQELESATEAAGMRDWVEDLPQGYETIIGVDGIQLSGGQTQRLAVARAVVKDAPVVLLDEPTAHLDALTQRAVQVGLDRLLAGRTVMVVAHRLGTVERADEILVLVKGRIVEHGSHESLLEHRGVYSRLREAYQGSETG